MRGEGAIVMVRRQQGSGHRSAHSTVTLFTCSCPSLPHVRVQSTCCAVDNSVVSSAWPIPLTSVRRLRATDLVSCVLCVHRKGVPDDVLHGDSAWCLVCEVCRLGRLG